MLKRIGLIPVLCLCLLSEQASAQVPTVVLMQNIREHANFIGKYGIPSTTNGKDMMWLLNSEGSLSLDVRDTGRGIVGYLSISTPGSWNLQKVQSFCLAFAPHDYRLDQISTPNNSSSLYVYDSPNGKFALHVSSGYPMYCFMNTLP